MTREDTIEGIVALFQIAATMTLDLLDDSGIQPAELGRVLGVPSPSRGHGGLASLLIYTLADPKDGRLVEGPRREGDTTPRYYRAKK